MPISKGGLFVVGEVVLRGCREVETSVDECCHLSSGHRVVGAEQVVVRWVAPFSDPLAGRLERGADDGGDDHEHSANDCEEDPVDLL